jgi:hypothetical protein
MSSSTNVDAVIEVTEEKINATVNDSAPVEEKSTAPPSDGRRRSHRLSSIKRVIMREVDEFGDEEEEGKEEAITHNDNCQEASVGPPSIQQPKTKKRRKSQSKEVKNAIEKPKIILYREPTSYEIDFDLLCGGIIQIIYGFLSTSRDLFNVSQCSKRLRSLISYEHVIRSAVFSPMDYQVKKIENIVARVGDRFIFVPSVQRLLRFVNGKRCERGKSIYQCCRLTSFLFPQSCLSRCSIGADCWSYNLKTKMTPRVTCGNSGISVSADPLI